MLVQAARENSLNLADCWIVGDSPSDILAGSTVGCKTAQIIDLRTVEMRETQSDISGNSLQEAVTQILEWDSDSHGRLLAR